MIIQKKTEDLQPGDVIIDEVRYYKRQTVRSVEIEPLPCVVAKVITDKEWFYSGIHGIHNVETNE